MEICIPSVKNVFLLAKGSYFYFHLYIYWIFLKRNSNSAGECDFIGDVTLEGLNGCTKVEKGEGARGVGVAWIN